MIPNILTTVRLLVIPVFAYYMLSAENFWIAAALFLFSGITDVVDGIIARKFNMITDVGSVYDPFVDKLMQLTAVVCLTIKDIVPLWVIIIVAVKEVTMITVGSILYIKKIVVHSNWYGKFATVFFYGVILLLICYPEMDFVFKTAILSLLVLVMFLAAVGYLVKLTGSNGEEVYKKKAN